MLGENDEGSAGARTGKQRKPKEDAGSLVLNQAKREQAGYGSVKQDDRIETEKLRRGSGPTRDVERVIKGW